MAFRRTCSAVCVLLAMAAAPPSPVGAGVTLRASRQVVTLRVTSDGRELARLSVPERGRARVSREGGETLGLTPEIQGDRLKLVVSLQTAYGPNGPVFTPWKTYSLAPDVPTTIDTGQTRFEIEWVAAATKPAPETLTDGCRECCITCFEFTYCACEVITPCGRCCCPETCGCIIITESLGSSVLGFGDQVGRPGQRHAVSGGSLSASTLRCAAIRPRSVVTVLGAAVMDLICSTAVR